MMKTKGWLFRLIALCVLIAAILSFALAWTQGGQVYSVYAAEISEEDAGDGETPAPPVDDPPSPEPEPEPELEPPEESAVSQIASEISAFFDRIIEWFNAHRMEVVNVIGNVILIIYMIVENVKSKKKRAEIGSNILSVKDGVKNTNTLQGDVVNVTNELIEGYNRFETALNEFGEKEQERYKTMTAAFVQTKAILKIMTTVYANSKNIPQGVKDLVNLEYADVLKLVGDEKKLQEIVEPEKSTENIESAPTDEVNKKAEE